jgi:hypothetical protein
MVKKYIQHILNDDKKLSDTIKKSYHSPLSTHKIKKAQQMYEKIITKPNYNAGVTTSTRLPTHRSTMSYDFKNLNHHIGSLSSEPRLNYK